jgi:hypothetical protein
MALIGRGSSKKLPAAKAALLPFASPWETRAQLKIGKSSLACPPRQTDGLD